MIEQYLSEIIGTAAALVAFVLIIGIFYGLNYLRTQKTNKTIQWFAELAYSQAERAGKTYLSNREDKSTAKFEEAVQTLTDMLKTKGVKVDPKIIVNAVQWAWQKFEGIPKQQGSTAVINTELVGAERVIQEAAQKELSKVITQTKTPNR